MKMIRFSIPVLFILCCSIICFSFVTVDAQGRRAQPDNVQNKIRELEYLVKILKNQLDNSVRFISIYFRPFPFNLFVANYKK
jgi:F0F1-type ATP synthase membrane subunit a